MLDSQSHPIGKTPSHRGGIRLVRLYRRAGLGRDIEREQWAEYKIRLDVLRQRIQNRAAASGGTADFDPAIERLLEEPPHSEATSFLRLYEAEQRLALHMNDTEVRAEAVRQLGRAERLGVATYDIFQKIFTDKRATDESRHAAYIALLTDLQAADHQLRLDRCHRSIAARRLNAYGSIIIGIGGGMGLYFYTTDYFSQLGPYHMLAVMGCGLTGAFLSRMIAFQRVLSTIGTEAITTDFSHFAILLRLIIGTMGALVVYFLIVGQVLDGDFFPNWTADSPVWQRFSSAPATANGEQPEFNIVSVDFAQLLIWATIAGFSERIVPDRFARMEIALAQPRS